MTGFRTECRCRCHGHAAPEEYCCPECDPDAYDACARCACVRYEHEGEERSPKACDSFEDPAT